MVKRIKKMMLVGILLILLVGIVGCKSKKEDDMLVLTQQVDSLLEEQSTMEDMHKELMKKIEQLEQEKVELQQMIDSMKYEFIGNGLLYVGTEDTVRFINQEASIRVLPYSDTPIIRNIFINSVITVNDAVSNNRGETWYYVEIPVYDTPMDYKGWIKEDETIPYTEECKKILQGDVWIKDGAPIIENSEFPDENEDIQFEKAHSIRLRIEAKKDNYVMIAGVGGMSVIVKEEYVIYPEVPKKVADQ